MASARRRSALLTVLVLIIASAGCGSTTLVRSRPQESVTTRPPHHPRVASASDVTRIGPVTLRHPPGWQAYLVPDDGMDLPDGDGAFLTDEPVRPRCVTPSSTPAGSTAIWTCSTGAFPVDPGNGHVVIEVEADYRPRDQTVEDDLTIGGYPAEGQIASAGASGLVERDGEPVSFCSPAVSHAEQYTAVAPSVDVQPSTVVITACFGSDTDTARRQFATMLGAAIITTRPSETVPVAGTAVCRRGNLRLRYSHQGSSHQILGSYTVTNIGRTTCHLRGYPTVVLRLPDGTTARARSCPAGPVRPAELYLRPDAGIAFASDAFWDDTGQATTEVVTLPGVAGYFALAHDPGPPFFRVGQCIAVSALAGD